MGSISVATNDPSIIHEVSREDSLLLVISILFKPRQPDQYTIQRLG